MPYRNGYEVGNGAAINVQVGFSPDRVRLTNMTDGDIITDAILSRQVVPFSSGGTTEVAVGNTINGATSHAYGIVEQVLLYSGSWAGGDAAGFFIVRLVTGTFTSENVYVGSGTDDATVTAALTPNQATTTAVATATGNSAISRYAGSAGTAAPGFTIGSTIAEEAKALFWEAWVSDY